MVIHQPPSKAPTLPGHRPEGADGVNTTLDDFLGGIVRLRQPRSGFRAGLDSVILAAAVDARPGEILFEPGMGVGVASVCLAARIPGIRIIGVEMDRTALALARANVNANGFTHRIAICPGNIAAPPPPIASAHFDQVFLNPPFQEDGAGTPPPNPSRAQAHMALGGPDLEGWLQLALERLKPKGRLTLVHRSDRLDRILAVLAGRLGEITVHPLWPMAGRAAKRVLITGRRDVRGGLTISPGLVLHEPDGRPRPILNAIARHGAAFRPDGLGDDGIGDGR